MKTLKQLQAPAKDYADKFNDLRNEVDALNYEIEQLKQQHLVTIRAKVAAVKTSASTLTVAIRECDDCFVKPRTVIMEGIKFGKQKKKGSISFDKNSIELIKSKLPDLADKLIVVKETISKTAAANLSVKELRAISGVVVADSDEVLIKSADSNVDKLVATLLKDDAVKL